MVTVYSVLASKVPDAAGLHEVARLIPDVDVVAVDTFSPVFGESIDMVIDLISVSPTERIIHARRLMLEEHVGRLPVVDEGELVGMITSKDLMRAFIEFRKSVPEKYQKSQIKDLLVEDIMSKNPTFVSKDLSITEVSNIIMETGFNGLPVVEDGEVIGIITQTDILRLIEKLES